MTGRSGDEARARGGRRTRSSSIMARMSSAVSCSTLATSCEVRKPSKKWRKGRRDSRVAAWAISAMSMTSCTELEESMPKPVERAAITSLWSPKIERACAASARAAMWKTVRGQFAGDLVHVGDHQQQALRCGEGGGERPRLQGAVQGAGGAAFALHLDDRGHGAPDVGLLFGGPLVRPFAHVGRRRNGINGDDFVGSGARRRRPPRCRRW